MRAAAPQAIAIYWQLQRKASEGAQLSLQLPADIVLLYLQAAPVAALIGHI